MKKIKKPEYRPAYNHYPADLETEPQPQTIVKVETVKPLFVSVSGLPKLLGIPAGKARQLIGDDPTFPKMIKLDAGVYAWSYEELVQWADAVKGGANG